MSNTPHNSNLNFTNEVNDSKFNNPNHFTEKKNNKGPFLATIALALTIIAGGGGFLAANSGNKTPDIPNVPTVEEPINQNGDGSEVVIVTTENEQITTENTTEATTNFTTEATTEITTEATTTAATSAEATSETTEVAGSLEIFEATVSIEAMEAMSIEEFAQLSYVDRATYAYTILNGVDVADLDDKFNPDKVVTFYWQGLNKSSLGRDDVISGAKCLSALDYYSYDHNTNTITDSLQSTINYINDYGGTDYLINHTYVYINSGEPQTWVDTDVLNATGEMKSLDYTNVTYNIIAGNGEETDIVTSQLFQIPIKLPDGRTIVAYPRGYSIKGEASPIPGKNY